ncbi:hypothetical protein [Anthocerotibacter panamensis]|uniref:hypothetical protein n=1 Tax=Anthocerotibacter panamensis TaxID=2857077 RepID=UPI001C40721C|nr:hypothetical protein [Anthocerotibacter panamensis]
MDWKEELENVLLSYFSDQTIQVGIKELVMATQANEDDHRTWILALETAIQNSIKDSTEVVDILTKSFVVHVNSPQEARRFLEGLRDEYLAHYKTLY